MNRPKYGILILSTLRLVKCSTKDEMKIIVNDLEKKGNLYEVFKDCGEIYSKLDQWK